MLPSATNGSGSKQTTLEAIKRRQVGKREWKAMLNEVLESERADIARLRTLRSRHADAETQRIIAEMLEEKAERVIKLTELYHYNDRESQQTNGNGGDT